MSTVSDSSNETGKSPADTCTRYCFGDFEMDTSQFVLTRESQVVPIDRKTFDLLRFLIANRERVLGKDEILDAVWGYSVGEAVITTNIKEARRIIGDTPHAQRFIRTVRGRGYQFVAHVSESSAAPEPPEDHGALDVPFVGRKSVVSAMRELIRRAQEGGGHAVLLVGEAGIGKTRTAEVVAEAAEELGFRVLVGRCEAEGPPALWPWHEALETALQSEPSSESARLPSIMGGAKLDESDRYRLFDEVWHFLRDLSLKQPVLLFLDDLQWADAQSLQLFEFAARRAADHAIVILGAIRDESEGGRPAVGQLMATIAKHPHGHRVVLAGLSAEEVEELLTAAIGRPPPTGLVSEVIRLTNGSPLFIREILSLWREEGKLGFPELIPDWSVGVPPGVREAIERRLESLSEECREILSRAAVLGQRFSLAVLQPSTSNSYDQLVVALEEAVRADMIKHKPRSIAYYEFKHGLVRDVIYDGIPELERARMHQRLGETLESKGAGETGLQLSELARHFCAAAVVGEFEKAVGYSVHAAEKAESLLAFEEAAGHYRRAVQALEFAGSDQSPRRLEQLLKLGYAHRAVGDYERMRTAMMEAAELARELDDAESFAEAALGYGGWGFSATALDETAKSLAREACIKLPASQRSMRARLLSRVASMAPFANQPNDALEATREALRLANSSKDPEAMAEALRARIVGLAGPDYLADRAELAREGMGFAVDANRSDIAFELHHHLATDALIRGSLDDYRDEFSELQRIATAMQHPSYAFPEILMDAGFLIICGDIEAGDARANEAVSIGQRYRHPWAMAAFLGQAYSLLRERDRFQDLLQFMPITREYKWSGGAHITSVPAHVLSEVGRLDDAQAYLDGLFQGCESWPRGGDWLCGFAEIAPAVRALGDKGKAERLRDWLAPYADLHAVLPGSLVYGGPVRFHLAVLARVVDSDAAKVLDELEVARDAAAALGAAPTVGRIELEIVDLLMSRGRREDRLRARDLLEKVQAVAAQRGFAHVARRARALAASHQVLES